MKSLLAALALGASIATASSVHGHPLWTHAKLVARQGASGNSTRFGQCTSECADFLGFETSCDAGADDGKDTNYGCACKREVFDAARRCGTCVPEAFENLGIEGGLDGFIKVGIDSCNALGFPVDMGLATSSGSTASQASSQPSSTSSSASTTRGSSSITAPASTRSPLSSTIRSVSSAASSAAAAPTGAAVPLQAASGLAALGVAAGLVLLA